GPCRDAAGRGYTGLTVSGYRRRGVGTSRPRSEATPERHVRSRWSLPLFAAASSLAFVVASMVSPHPVPSADALAPAADLGSQTLAVGTGVEQTVTRDGYQVSRHSTAPAVGVPDPGSAQAIAYELVLARGWSQGEYSCLVALWNRESRWNVYAHNPSS